MERAQISYYYKKTFLDFSMHTMHTHTKNNYEVMYVSSGKCEIVIPDKTIYLTSGNFIIIGNSCPHYLRAENADIINLEFYIHDKGVSIKDVLTEYPVLAKILALENSTYLDNGEVYSILKEIVSELQNYGKGVCSDLILKRLLIEICRTHNKNSIGGVSYIGETKKYIAEHLFEKLTIEEISNHVGLNHSYLQTLFKRHTGKTIIDYINSLRIEKACFIMRNTNLPIIDIAIDCGFSSRQHFMYTFKKHTGVNAREYRKNIV